VSFWSKLKPPKSLRGFGEEVVKVAKTVQAVGQGITTAAEEAGRLKDEARRQGRSVAEVASDALQNLQRNRQIVAIAAVVGVVVIGWLLMKRRR
jgi:ElaB/YqjD/DUF883 family membrane-anchored ribosome-binding protein